MKLERYLGDGVYATFDGYQIWLDCRGQDGFTIGPSCTQSIALEPVVLRELRRFTDDVTKSGIEPESEPQLMAVFNRPECPFNYCDQEPPYTACQEHCRHRTPAAS